eukprot:TRINITY_DN1608_c3_g1_i1.p1 TRINITY_DN1608_c3_g1~~TRINITY_DN1608_c3_g1_i1.p1  ORF type:complete len:510 (+),score=63.12 TRINITY_DN1608_c3_g1_i1:46-1530(+)
MIDPTQGCCCTSIAASFLCGLLMMVRNDGSDRRTATYAIGVGFVLLFSSLQVQAASALIWPFVYFTVISTVVGYLISAEATKEGAQYAQIVTLICAGLSVLDMSSNIQSTGWPEPTQSRLLSVLSLALISFLFSYYYVSPKEVSSFVFVQLLLIVASKVYSVRAELEFVHAFFQVATVYPIGSFIAYYTSRRVRQTAAVCLLFLMSAISAVETYNEIASSGRKLVFYCCLWTCFAACAGVFITSTLSGHVGQVDKLWSIMPVIYSFIALSHHPDDKRLQLMCFCVSIWGSRLTYNFYKRGGFPSNPLRFWEGELDYRWPIVREKIPFLQSAVGWFFFNLFVITIYQMVLILWFSLPVAYCADEARNKPLTLWDLFCAGLMLSFIVLEHISDEQHQVFQKQKRSGRAMPMHFGFFDRKLFSVVRHPNYASEQCIWFSCFLFTLPHGPFLNWSSPGCLFLAMLFIGSSKLSEGITTSKYPKYVEFQEKVPRFFPGL